MKVCSTRLAAANTPLPDCVARITMRPVLGGEGHLDDHGTELLPQ
jgi:hypothetical protein